MKRKAKTVWYGNKKVEFTPFIVGGYKFTEYLYSKIGSCVMISTGRTGFLNKIPKYWS